MSRKTSLELKSKTRYRKKTLFKDQDLSVILIIPVFSTKEQGEKPSPSVLVEETALESGRVLEISLVKPLINTFREIVSSVDKNIIISFKAMPLNYVSILKFSPKLFINVTSLSIEKDVHPMLTSLGDLIRDVRRNILSMFFEKLELVKILSVEKSVHIKVTPSIVALNYVMLPRLVFHRPYLIDCREMASEVMVKTSESIGLIGDVGALPESTLIEQEDVLEYCFNASLSKVVMNRPFLIFAEKPSNDRFEYIEFLKRLLRELFRVFVGGLPFPRDLQIGFEEVKLDIRADKHIYVIDVDNVFKDHNQYSTAKKYIVDRFKELYSQGLGFLIFYGSSKNLVHIKGVNIGKRSLWYTLLPSDRLFGKVLRPIQVNVLEDLRVFKLANLIWGKIVNFKHVEDQVDLDSYVVMLEDEFYRKIVELASNPKMIVKVEPSKHDEEKLNGESLLHYGVKAFIAKYLIENEKIADYDVFTEYEVGDVILDVFVKHPEHGDLAIEVETLYGTTLPLLKLRKTIDSRLSKGLKVWIVIPNPQFILFLKDLAKLRTIYRQRYLDAIEFFTLDIYSHRLIPFSKIIGKIRQIVSTK